MTTTQRTQTMTQTMNDHDHIVHNLARTRGGALVAITHCPPGELGEPHGGGHVFFRRDR